MPDKQDWAARRAFALSAPATARIGLVLAFYLLSLAVQLPGNVPYDGITVWHEAETARLYAQHPAALVLVWHLAGLLVRGPALFTSLQLLSLWAAAAVVIARLRPPLWAAACFCLCLFAFPPLFAFAGVTVKDVFGGHLALLAFAIALPDARGPHRAGSWIAAFAFAALATMFRYQLGLMLAVLALLLWWEGRREPTLLKRSALAAMGGVVGTYAVVTLAVFVLFTQGGPGDVQLSLRKMMVFDIAGVVANDASAPLTDFAQAGVGVPPLKARMRQDYTPTRVDTLWQENGKGDSVFAPAGVLGMLALVPDRVVFGQWLSLARTHPAALIRHRLAAFARVLGFGSVYQCRPIRPGISLLPSQPAAAVNAKSYHAPFSAAVMQSRFFPVSLPFRAWLYAVVCFGVLAAGFTGRRVPREVMALSAFGLAYEASFFFLPQACEVRYSYPLLLAALLSLAMIGFAALKQRPYV